MTLFHWIDLSKPIWKPQQQNQQHPLKRQAHTLLLSPLYHHRYMSGEPATVTQPNHQPKSNLF